MDQPVQIDYLPADIYDDEFVADQVAKFRDRATNHWKHRMARVIDLLKIEPATRVLDLACGIGAFTIESAMRGYDVVGVDYSKPSIRAARHLATELETPNARFVIGDATQLSFDTGAFDAVIAADIVEHLFDIPLERMFSECFRVLRPGGRLIIHTTPTRYRFLFSPLRILPLLPFAWLPQKPLDRLIELYERYPFGAVYKLVYGQTHQELTATRVHCNCPSFYHLDAMLERVGFRLELYEAGDSPEDLQKRRSRILAAAFRNSKHARAHLWAVCRKP